MLPHALLRHAAPRIAAPCCTTHCCTMLHHAAPRITAPCCTIIVARNRGIPDKRAYGHPKECNLPIQGHYYARRWQLHTHAFSSQVLLPSIFLPLFSPRVHKHTYTLIFPNVRTSLETGKLTSEPHPHRYM